MICPVSRPPVCGLEPGLRVAVSPSEAWLLFDSVRLTYPSCYSTFADFRRLSPTFADFRRLSPTFAVHERHSDLLDQLTGAEGHRPARIDVVLLRDRSVVRCRVVHCDFKAALAIEERFKCQRTRVFPGFGRRAVQVSGCRRPVAGPHRCPQWPPLRGHSM